MNVDNQGGSENINQVIITKNENLHQGNTTITTDTMKSPSNNRSVIMATTISNNNNSNNNNNHHNNNNNNNSDHHANQNQQNSSYGHHSNAPILPYNHSSNSIVALNLPHEITLSRRPSILMQEILSTRRNSGIISAIRTPPHYLSPNRSRMIMGSLRELDPSGSSKSINIDGSGKNSEQAIEFRRKNRRTGDDALTAALSALYAKIIIILGVALPITEVLTGKISTGVYQGFYIFLYTGSIIFVIFVYMVHLRSKTMYSFIKSYHQKTNQNVNFKRRVAHFGSFYLRVGAISFGIGTMVYSGLEFGQYFEISKNPDCTNFLIALTPAARMTLSIIQMQFIFLNTTELDMAKHKVIARFGLMHMIATNLCEWLYVLVEETKHEIHHFLHDEAMAKLISSAPFLPSTTITTTTTTTTTPQSIISTSYHDLLNTSDHQIVKRSIEQAAHDCARTNIMGSLIQNASPFLFPCTIEYSLICAVILYEMWKKIKSVEAIEKTRKMNSKSNHKKAHHFSVDCARAHRGMFAGILIIVLTIICLIMYFVLYDVTGYEHIAIKEVTICEILLYTVTTIAVIAAVIKMRDLKYQSKSSNDHHASSIKLDCTLLIFAQTGVYVYGMFSIIGSYFVIDDDLLGGKDGLIAEVFSLIQTSVQTLFILNTSWRRCRGAEQNRNKPGRQIVTFLLVANMSMWFINTLIKGRAGFRPSHLSLYGIWAWTVITHVSMPLAIFYRFHSTICLFEIWKSAYKSKSDH